MMKRGSFSSFTRSEAMPISSWTPVLLRVASRQHKSIFTALFCSVSVICLRQRSPGSRVRMSAKTVYPAASRRGASQSTNSSSSGVALLMNTMSRVLLLVPSVALGVVA